MTSLQPGWLTQRPRWRLGMRAGLSWQCSRYPSLVSRIGQHNLPSWPAWGYMSEGQSVEASIHILLPAPLCTRCAAGTPAKLLAEAVRATMQLHCMAGRPQQALAHLVQQLVALRDARVLQGDMEGLWVTAAAGTAAARDSQLLQQVLDGARAWAAEADADSAAFQARLCSMEAAASLAAQQAARAVRQYSRAVHLCPTAAVPWAGLAATLLMRPEDGGRSAAAALRLCELPALLAAVQADKQEALLVPPAGKVRSAVQHNLPGCAVRAGGNSRPLPSMQCEQGYLFCVILFCVILLVGLTPLPQCPCASLPHPTPPHPTHPHNTRVQAMHVAVAEASTAATLAARQCTPEQLQRRLSAAARCVHEAPASARLWYLGALTAKQAAAVDGSSISSERAWRWCRAAEGAAAVAAAEVVVH